MCLQNKKCPSSQSSGTKGKPSAVPPAFAWILHTHFCPCNGGHPSCSHRPLPGEPSDTHQGGFQPVTASLWDGQTRYFPVQHISTNHNLYHIFCVLARGNRKVVDFFGWFGGEGVPSPGTGDGPVLFPRRKSTKSAHKGRGVSMPLAPYVSPHPKTTQRGAPAPLWILPASPMVVLFSGQHH